MFETALKPLTELVRAAVFRGKRHINRTLFLLA